MRTISVRLTRRHDKLICITKWNPKNFQLTGCEDMIYPEPSIKKGPQKMFVLKHLIKIKIEIVLLYNDLFLGTPTLYFNKK